MSTPQRKNGPSAEVPVGSTGVVIGFPVAAEDAVAIAWSFGALAVVSFILIVIACVKYAAKVGAPSFAGKDQAAVAVNMVFATLFLLAIPGLNLIMAIAALALVSQL